MNFNSLLPGKVTGGGGMGLAGGTQGKEAEMGVRVDTEMGRGRANPASSFPKGTGSFPIFPMCRSRGPPPALGFGGYRQKGGTEGRGGTM